MKPIVYDSGFLNFLNSIAPIRQSIVLRKNNDKLEICQTNPSNTMFYKLSANSSALEFEGNEIAFLDFSEFHRILSCFEKPELLKTEQTIVIKQGRTKVNYVLGDPENIPEAEEQKFSDYNFEVDMDENEQREITKMINLLDVKKVKLTVEADVLTMDFYNNSHNNSFSRTLTGKNLQGKDFSFKMFVDIFNVIPKGKYTLNLKEGIVNLSIKRDGVNFDIFTGSINE